MPARRFRFCFTKASLYQLSYGGKRFPKCSTGNAATQYQNMQSTQGRAGAPARTHDPDLRKSTKDLNRSKRRLKPKSPLPLLGETKYTNGFGSGRRPGWVLSVTKPSSVRDVEDDVDPERRGKLVSGISHKIAGIVAPEDPDEAQRKHALESRETDAILSKSPSGKPPKASSRRINQPETVSREVLASRKLSAPSPGQVRARASSGQKELRRRFPSAAAEACLLGLGPLVPPSGSRFATLSRGRRRYRRARHVPSARTRP